MKTLQLLALALVMLALFATPVLAQDSQLTPHYTLAGAAMGAGLGAGLTIIGAGIGFSKIGSAALESMARQPEVAGRIQTGMIIIGALLEGVTLFALIICILVSLKVTF
jgi:F-type H+-transporting ATPase subunit c